MNRTFKLILIKCAGVLFLLGIAFGLFKLGIKARAEIFKQTLDFRYEGDAQNAYAWGARADSEGVLNVYENIATRKTQNGPKRLDYPPLRLTMASRWVHWTGEHFRYRGWEGWDYPFIQPMLELNTSAELISSVLVFLLIRMWRIRADDAIRPATVPPRHFRGVIPGMIGAALFWFNPGVLWVSHVWPQWDIWLVPFFLAAILLACVESWFFAGICIAVGSCFKGQLLFAAPLLILWPLFRLNWPAIVSLVCGFMFGFVAVIFAWMNPSDLALHWLYCFAVAAALACLYAFRIKPRWYWLVPAAIGAILLSWPWQSNASIAIRVLPIAIASLIALARFLPRMMVPQVMAGSIALASLTMMPLFNAQSSWFRIGFQDGTTKFTYTALSGTSNLPAILMNEFRFSSDSLSIVELPLLGKMQLRTELLLAYGVCVLISSIGAAIHSKRRDPRFLVAVATPWLCMFVLLTQLNNRYLVWAAALSALFAGVSAGMTLLGIVLSFVCMTGVAQIASSSAYYRPMLQATFPGIAWLVILAAGIHLYLAVVPRRRGSVL